MRHSILFVLLALAAAALPSVGIADQGSVDDGSHCLHVSLDPNDPYVYLDPSRCLHVRVEPSL